MDNGCLLDNRTLETGHATCLDLVITYHFGRHACGCLVLEVFRM